MKFVFLLLVAVVVAFVAADPDKGDKTGNVHPSPAQPASKAGTAGESAKLAAAPPRPFYDCDVKVESSGSFSILNCANYDHN